MYSRGTKGLSRLMAWLLDLLDRADRSLCVEEDEFAVRMGWTVTKTGFGSRLYRDPRFERLGTETTGEVSGNVAA